MIKMKFLPVLVLALCLTAQTAFGQETIVTPDAQRGYLVGPGDVITIKVLGEPEFNVAEVIVDEDGKIQVPFAEKGVLAQCRTERELTADVRQLLSKYLRNPQASVYVSKRNSRPPVTIYGEVRAQQQVVLTRKASLLDILASAGGITEKAGGMIQVFRTQKPMCVELTAENDWSDNTAGGVDIPSRIYSIGSLRQGSKESNPEVFPGDIIVVQKASPVYVVGEVLRPGEMIIPEGGLPLMQAVAMASGITREAKTKTIKIYRRKQGAAQPEVIIVNYDSIKKGEQKDVILEPYDIVEVDKAKKKIGDILYDFMIGIPGKIPLPIRPF